jgi:PPOX class probable F420-dependent enzyme
MTDTVLPDDVRELVAGPNNAHLATLLPDGSPHSVPLWIGLHEDHVAFLTGPGSRKARNIEHDPRVALSITAADNPFSAAYIRGRVVRVIDGDEAWPIIDELANKYIGQPYPMRTGRAIYLIQPEHASAQVFG